MNKIYLSGIVTEAPVSVCCAGGSACTFLLSNEQGTYRINAALPVDCTALSTGDEIRLSGRLSQRCARLCGSEIVCTEILAEEIRFCNEDVPEIYPALTRLFETTICQKLLAVMFLALLIRFTGDD